MAGNYSDYPDNRLAYHLDGTAGFAYRLGDTPAVLSAGHLATINNDSSDAVSIRGLANGPSSDQHILWGLVFATPMDLDSVFERQQAGGYNSQVLRDVQVSTDTTNGQDGVWSYSRGWSNQVGVVPDYRSTAPVATAASGAKGIRWRLQMSDWINQWDTLAIHLFGKPSSSSDRLDLWDASVDQRIEPAELDWGNAARLTSDTRNFRVKNRSATLTANSITVSTSDTTTSGAMASMMDLSQGGAYAATQNIGALPPGGVSGVLTLRRTWGSSQTLGAHSAIVTAAPGSWT